ncbi:BTAD domain-containing putative transcriptional regulator [Nonomuraea sp. CA-143628]|uniref:BTAD domain-containing putative transcriptional regulator n=1 Tax=Nonomuraea sp. CA-143628 TaxID=3239997 RepID=UPI003D91CA96
MLAVLLAAAGARVPIEEIVDVLWGEEPPASAVNIVQRYVGRLRRVLEPEPGTRAGGGGLVREAGGYRLDVTAENLDLLEFRELVERAAAADSPKARAEALLRGLALWHGQVGAGIEAGVRRHAVFTALEREHTRAVRLAADAALEAGLASTALAVVQSAAEAHVLDESLQARLMLLLAETGQQAAALAVFHTVRQRLADELGVDPGHELRGAHADILRRTTPKSDRTTPKSDQRRPPPGGSVPAAALSPAQLPADLAAFTGRRGPMAELLAVTGSGEQPTVVISAIGGMAGVGKTTLAVHLAHQLAHRFTDGQLYVNLRGFDRGGRMVAPEEALRDFLTALGVSPANMPSGLDALAARYRTHLAGRRMLVLLDNARDVEQVMPLLPGAGGSLVIVTSRSQLAGLAATHGAHLLSLDAMSVAEARDFLARRLGADRVSAEPEAVTAIIDRCARLPLALAVVAARAMLNSTFPLADTAEQLREAAGSLQAFTGPGAAIDVRAVFFSSLAALSEAAARTFRLLSLHPTGNAIGVAAVASLTSVSPAQARTALAELSAAHLLTQPTPARYAFHDLLRAYAAELVRDDERADATRRLVDHYLHSSLATVRLIAPHHDPIPLDPPCAGTVVAEFGNAQEAVTWLTAEQSVFVPVIEAAAREGLDGHAWRLAWVLSEYFERWGRWDDWFVAQHIALAAARRLGEAGALARSHLGLGTACEWLRRDDEARENLTRAIDLYRDLNDPGNQARASRVLVRFLSNQGHLPEAQKLCEGIGALYELTGDRNGQANVLTALGDIHTRRGNHEAGLSYCRQALVILQELGATRAVAATWDTIGYALHHLRRWQEAISAYRQAADLRHACGDLYPEAATPGAWHFGFFALRNGMPEQLIDGREAVWVDRFTDSLEVNKKGIGPRQVREFARYLRDDAHLRASLEWFRAFPADIADNAVSITRKLPMPVLAIGASGSLGDFVPTQVKRYASDVTGAVIHASGHWIYEERPTELTRLLLGFLD